MEMLAKKVYDILKGKGVEELHHANSVITSCQFLKTASLISRGTLHRRGVFQTPQKSDRIDRGYGIWFDIFTDSVDIHFRASTNNLYGPVLFVLDSAVLTNIYTGRVWLTKLNPTKWSGKSYSQRWFTSEEDLEKNFVLGEFDQMIVFRHCGGELPLPDYLKKIVLDDPQATMWHSKINYYDMAYGALRLAMAEGGLTANIEKRPCRPMCTCVDVYQKHGELTRNMFVTAVGDEGWNRSRK